MNALPPESSSGADADTGMTSPQLAGPGRSGQPAPRWMSIACGTLWAVIAVGIGAGGAGELAIGNIGGAVVCIVIAALCGWYDYLVWTRKARVLVLVFVNRMVGPPPVPPWRRRP
jgi:hypothetical protein